MPAHPANVHRLLFDERELVLVFPEGRKGTEKPYSQRYRLRRNFLKRMTGQLYFPITPTFPWLGPLGMFAYLPAKFRVRFLEPIDPRELAGDAEPGAPRIQTVAQEVRARIQDNLDAMVVRRRSVWFG